MKKIISSFVVLGVLAVILASCGSSPKAKAEEPIAPVVKPVIGADGVPMPAWVNKTPKSETTFYAVGYGAKSSRQISKTAAEQDARDQISRWVGTSVKNALTNYVSEGGEGKNVQTITHFENISKQVTEQSIVGAELDEVWADDKGGIYALCSFPKANVNKSFEDVSGTFIRNEAAAFAEFKAKEALKFLDAETAKE